MPSVSRAQARLMAAAAHNKRGYGGVSQAVGKDFNQADTGRDLEKLPERKTNPVSKKDKARRRYSGKTFKDRSDGNAELDSVVVKGKV